MTFPATYNINYYLGDTHEFNVYPKDSSGGVFPMSNYTDVQFVMAPSRGTLDDPSQAIQGYAAFSVDRTHIQCAITPDNAANIDPDIQYVFDVKISKEDSPYDLVYTLLTGGVTIQDNVEDFVSETPSAPNSPIALQEVEIAENYISISWQPSTEGAAPDGYYVYVTPYSTDYEDFLLFGQFTEAWFESVPFETADTSFVITETMDIPGESIDGAPLQPGTAYLYAVVAYNEIGSSNPTGNFDLIETTIDETFTLGGS